MTLHRSLLVASMGIGLLATGCLAQSDDVNKLGDVELEAQDLGDPNGGGGQNGLLTDEYNNEDGLLWGATSMGLHDPNNTYVDQLNSSNSEVLAYAIRCAQSGTVTIGTRSYQGEDLLSTTSGWATGGLALSARLDVMTCMLAHLNPYGAHINLRLTGNSVNNSLSVGAATQFNMQEALWVVRQSVTGGLERVVWPLDDLTLACPNSHSLLETRVCAHKGGEEMNESCYVDVRDDFATDCSQDQNTGNWLCLGRPAIKTRLDTLYLSDIHPGCGPIPQ